MDLPIFLTLKMPTFKPHTDSAVAINFTAIAIAALITIIATVFIGKAGPYFSIILLILLIRFFISSHINSLDFSDENNMLTIFKASLFTKLTKHDYSKLCYSYKIEKTYDDNETKTFYSLEIFDGTKQILRLHDMLTGWHKEDIDKIVDHLHFLSIPRAVDTKWPDAYSPTQSSRI